MGKLWLKFCFATFRLTTHHARIYPFLPLILIFTIFQLKKIKLLGESLKKGGYVEEYGREWGGG